ncbi:acyl-CoA dehydrogenase family protein [Streptomyces jumonjinensis]|uniref:Acyl-CoA dehydrogenase n=1 Tax=Streptomyces jumonjinensis TaxID=1945 RepID=A0A646KFP9_STRJU|nr:acyl-CoA dehydrogenase family protein [Streptomyces jumonjinensis]MQT01063.1 acyl-CoA dehydrogenase [Streptomyces jumonjinensis]
MDLHCSPEDDAFRAEARAWLAAHVPRTPLPSLETREGFAAHRAWEAELRADRWSAVSWPKEYGGRGVDLFRWLIFEEEYWAADAPGRVAQNGISLLAPTLFGHGSEEQRARVLPPMASGETVWAQAWSEPEAGSDLAALRSRADRTAGGWLLTGRKTWSSRAAFADRAFGIFRSDPGAGAPHRGLTYLMFDLSAPGVTVRPIGRLDGKPAFAELSLDRVFVPDEDVIGEPGQGWRIAMSATGNERGLTLRSPGRFLAAAERLVREWRAGPAPQSPVDDALRDPVDGTAALRERVADAVIGARAYQLFTSAAASRLAAGEAIGAEASLNKVFWSEYDIALHETALDLLGEGAEFADTAWAECYLFALAGPVYAGTNEIQRDIIAERLLGLPKGRR